MSEISNFGQDFQLWRRFPTLAEISNYGLISNYGQDLQLCPRFPTLAKKRFDHMTPISSHPVQLSCRVHCNIPLTPLVKLLNRTFIVLVPLNMLPTLFWIGFLFYLPYCCDQVKFWLVWIGKVAVNARLAESTQTVAPDSNLPAKREMKFQITYRHSYPIQLG
jgi:hypothetical protein